MWVNDFDALERGLKDVQEGEITYIHPHNLLEDIK